MMFAVVDAAFIKLWYMENMVHVFIQLLITDKKILDDDDGYHPIDSFYYNSNYINTQK